VNCLHVTGVRYSACSAADIRTCGFAYLEVMVAVLLIAIVLMPATDLLSSALLGSEVNKDLSSAHYRLVAKMEEVLAKPLPEIRQQADNAGSATAIVAAWSDSAGTPRRRLVYLSRYDADNADGDDLGFSGTEENLLWVKVRIENSDLQVATLVGAGP